MSASDLAFPFFVGCGRSGTTLLRVMFASHPEMAIPPETYFVASMGKKRGRYELREGFAVDRFVGDLAGSRWFGLWGVSETAIREEMAASPPESYATAVRTLFGLYARMRNKSRYGDKTPNYVSSILLLAEIFPEARFVHIIRDGRDVAMSIVESSFGPNDLGRAALYWRRRVEDGRAAGRVLGSGRYREVRYEDFVEDPEETLRWLCPFLDLGFHPAMLRYYQDQALTEDVGNPQQHRNLARPLTKGLRDWRKAMRVEDVVLFEALAGRTLRDLGYEAAPHPPTRGTSVASTQVQVRDSIDRSVRWITRPLRRSSVWKFIRRSRSSSDGQQPEPGGAGPASGQNPSEPAFLIVGTPRSGTTLVQRLASELPGVRIPPETHFFSALASRLLRSPFPPDESVVTRELQQYVERALSGADLNVGSIVRGEGGSRSLWDMFAVVVRTLAKDGTVYGEKTPDHLLWWRPLTSVRPRLKIVAVVRDPRAVLASLRRVPFGRRGHVLQAQRWAEDQLLVSRAQAELGPSRCLVLRYEDVVRDPDTTRSALSSFLGLPSLTEVATGAASSESLSWPWESWKKRASGPITAERLEAWRNELGQKECLEIVAICRRQMKRFGYLEGVPGATSAFFRRLRLRPGVQWRRLRARVGRRARLARINSRRVYRALQPAVRGRPAGPKRTRSQWPVE